MTRMQFGFSHIVLAALASSFLKEKTKPGPLVLEGSAWEHVVVAGGLWPHSPMTPPLWVRAKVGECSGSWGLICGQRKGAEGGERGRREGFRAVKLGTETSLFKALTAVPALLPLA